MKRYKEPFMNIWANKAGVVAILSTPLILAWALSGFEVNWVWVGYAAMALAAVFFSYQAVRFKIARGLLENYRISLLKKPITETDLELATNEQIIKELTRRQRRAILILPPSHPFEKHTKIHVSLLPPADVLKVLGKAVEEIESQIGS
jgi:hypothetical protein